MALIIITIVVMFLVLIFWSFTNLGKTNITKKILWMSLLFGIVFFTIMILILNYMRTRVGLDPNSYRKKDINYKEYIGLK